MEKNIKMNIIKYLGWVLAFILLLLHLTEINVFCMKQSAEVYFLEEKLDYRGFVKMEDFREFETAYNKILKDYPELSRDGWEMVMPTDLEEKIQVYYPRRASSTITFTFKPDGTYIVEAIK